MPKAQTAYGNPTKADTAFTEVTKADTGFAETTIISTDYKGNPSLTAVLTYNESGVTYAELLIPYIGRDENYNRNADKDDTDFERTIKTGQAYTPVTKPETEYS